MTTTQCLEDMRVAGNISRLYTPCHEATEKKCRQRKIKKAANIEDEQVIKSDAKCLVSGW